MTAGARLGAAILVTIALAAAGADLVALWLGHDADAPDLFARYAPPSAAHPLGQDELGRDVLLRLLYGARVSLAVGLLGAGLSALLGGLLGLLAAWRGGWVDAAIMRVADAKLALPSLPVLVILAAADFSALGGDVVRIALLIALFGWIGAARLARGATLSVLRQDFIRAAVAMGVPGQRIALRHVAPMVATPIIVAATLAVGGAILTESVLSFLGLGIRPPVPSWGAMLANAQEMVFSAPLLALWPGLCIAAAVLACNLLGDGLARRFRG